MVKKGSGTHYSWLKTVPCSDNNFKTHLAEADVETIEAVLQDLPFEGTKSKRKILESRLRRLRRAK